MKYCIIISCNPNTNLSHTALQFSKSVLDLKHQISLIFFQGDGVYHSLRVNNKDDKDWLEWLNLMSQNNVKLINCSSANIKRGLEIKDNSLIKVAGLGELIMAIKESDKVMKF